MTMAVVVFVERLTQDSHLPTKSTAASAGYDLYSPTETVLTPGSVTRVGLQIKIGLPENHCALLLGETLCAVGRNNTVNMIQISGRSGLALNGVICHNGLLDCDYSHEVSLLLYNNSTKDYTVEQGERIGQFLVVSNPVSSLLECAVRPTNRGHGFGSSGRFN